MTRVFLSDYSTGILLKGEKRLRRAIPRNAPHCGAKWPARGAERPRAFILFFSRTAQIPRKAPQTPRRGCAGLGCLLRRQRRTQGDTLGDRAELAVCRPCAKVGTGWERCTAETFRQIWRDVVCCSCAPETPQNSAGPRKAKTREGADRFPIRPFVSGVFFIWWSQGRAVPVGTAHPLGRCSASSLSP